MSYFILITLCCIVLIAYFFEITSKFSKIPSVILILCLGMLLRFITTNIGFSIPDLSMLLPLMGTLGLILIVLEGSMDLNLGSDKKKLILKSFSSAFLLFFVFIITFSLIMHFGYGFSFKMALLNAIPFGIISSAVAIPSSISLHKNDREFIVYESSVSDIVGILLFDFVLFNQMSLINGMMIFSMEVFATIIFSVIISIGLAYMLHKIGHHIKYVIILTSVVLIFTLAKIVHWPSLIVVLIFGLTLNNNHLFQNRYTLKYIDFNDFNSNLKSFKQITGELTFLVRSFFFLIFGYYTSLEGLFNFQTLLFSISIITTVFGLRALFFKFVIRKSLTPLLFFAPRGLITILLFLSIPAQLKLPFMTEGLIAQIIIISIIVMAFGNIITSHQKDVLEPTNTNINNE